MKLFVSQSKESARKLGNLDFLTPLSMDEMYDWSGGYGSRSGGSRGGSRGSGSRSRSNSPAAAGHAAGNAHRGGPGAAAAASAAARAQQAKNVRNGLNPNGTKRTYNGNRPTNNNRKESTRTKMYKALLRALQVKPAEGTLTSDYGPRVDPKTGVANSFHPGIDIANKEGTKIVATGPGKVVNVTENGESPTFGLSITIDHGNGITTHYNHLSKTSVKEGDSVPAGFKIGEMGSTGKSTGSHLDFMVRKDGKPNPYWASDGDKTHNPSHYFKY